jgi:hypothetical protein
VAREFPNPTELNEALLDNPALPEIIAKISLKIRDAIAVLRSENISPFVDIYYDDGTADIRIDDIFPEDMKYRWNMI